MHVEGLKAQLMRGDAGVSVLTKQNDGTYRYQSVKKETTLKTWPLALPAGALRSPWRPRPGPANFALVIRDGADLELNRAASPSSAKGNLARSLERTPELQVRPDKADYAPGATRFKVAIRGSLCRRWTDHHRARPRFRLGAGSKRGPRPRSRTIRVPDDLEGNAYINVSFPAVDRL